MPDAPKFALPGLMEITRPILEAQRPMVALPVKRVQDSLWLGIPSVGPVTPGGAQPTWPLALVEMVFGTSLPVVDVLFKASSSPATGDGTAVIGDPVAWLFSVPVQELPLPLNLYFWELRTTDSQGTVTTYYAGTQTVAP